MSPDPVSPEPVGGSPDPGDVPVRVLVVDDDPLVRSALTMVLTGGHGVELVGEATDGAEVGAAVTRTRPDVVLMDIRMPRVDGITATERLRRAADAPHVVVLTTFDTDDDVLRALRAGAAGFLLKDTRPADIVAAVRRVAEGETMLSPSVVRQVVARATAEQPADRPDPRRVAARRQMAQLSDREREVALAVGRGLSNAEIAAELYMSVATVKAYVSRVLARLGLDNRVQVALLTYEAAAGDDEPGR